MKLENTEPTIQDRALALVLCGRLAEARELLDWAENQGEKP